VDKGEKLSDAVAVDAKRILLRYGAPISVLDKITEADRIEFARTITRTALPDREARLRDLLEEHGYVEKS
jgi:bifunctional DNase/RNase